MEEANRFPPRSPQSSCLALPVFGAGHDKWVEVRSPNFIVVSNAGEGAARKVAVQFEQIRALFRDSFDYVRAHASPVITILAVKDEDSLRELLPEYWETKGHSHPAGIFINSFYQFQVGVDLAASGENPYEAIYHEYYHSVTMPYFPGLPVWMAEGLADLYGNTEIGDKDASVGFPSSALIAELRTHTLIPLATLFQVDHNSPYYNEQNKVSIFYAESWALTHYLVLGDQQAHQSAVATYLGALDQGATQEQAAAKAFGDLGKLQTDLEHYIHSFSFPYVKVPAPAKIAPNELQVRALSDAESDAYRGGFLVGHRQYKYAQPLLEEAARLDPQLALAQENLALLHYAQQERTEALASLSAAIALDSKNAFTRYLRASLSFSGGGAAARDPQVEDDLRQAVAANPNFAPTYGLLATYLTTQGEKLPEALDFAQKGVALEPGRTEYQFALAQVLARMRRYDEAEALARRVRAAAADTGERDQADRFLEYLGRAREAEARFQQQQAAAAERAREPVAGPNGNSVTGAPSPNATDDSSEPEDRTAPPRQQDGRRRDASNLPRERDAAHAQDGGEFGGSPRR